MAVPCRGRSTTTSSSTCQRKWKNQWLAELWHQKKQTSNAKNHSKWISKWYNIYNMHLTFIFIIGMCIIRISVVSICLNPPSSRHRGIAPVAVPQSGSSRRSEAKRLCRRLGRHPAPRAGRSASAVPESQEEPQGGPWVKPGKMEEWMVKQGETTKNWKIMENHQDYMWLICASLFHQWHGPIPNTADSQREREFTQQDPPKATGPLGWWLSAYICVASHKLSKIDRSHRKSQHFPAFFSWESRSICGAIAPPVIYLR